MNYEVILEYITLYNLTVVFFVIFEKKITKLWNFMWIIPLSLKFLFLLSIPFQYTPEVLIKGSKVVEMWPPKRHLLGFSLICMTVPLCWLPCAKSVSCYFAIAVTAWKMSKYDQKKLGMSQCLKHLIKCQKTTKLVESFFDLFCLGQKVFMCYVLPAYEKSTLNFFISV